MHVILAAAVALAAGSVAAQPSTPLAVVQHAYEPAPWWMDRPIMASTGHVTTEMQVNRASLSATYQAVDRDPATATKAAVQKAKAITGSLSSFGVDKVRVETRFTITPLYEQYRDKQGAMVDNERADKIDRYQVSIQVSVEIRDVRLAEPVYAILMSAKPSATQEVSFSLEPGDEARTQMFKLAVEDARRRAELAATAAGTKLGSVRLIDPTGRACQTDVLVALSGRSVVTVAPYAVPAPAMAPRVGNGALDELVVTARKSAQAMGLRPEDIQLPVQPPLEQLEATACVIYALG